MSNSCKESYVGGLAGENTGSIGSLTGGRTAVANFDMNSQIEARDKAGDTGCDENIYAGAFVGYNDDNATLENINLILNSKFVITDSGGLQEETTSLSIPCLTIRNNTERPITITEGSNTLIGNNPKKILQKVDLLLNKTESFYKKPDFWDGDASTRILKDLEKRISSVPKYV